MANRHAFEGLLGNETNKAALMGFTDRRAFPHALLISGPAGSGKASLAKLAAMAIACPSDGPRPCLACEACRKIAADISPDVITIGLEKDRRTIGVEAVRQIRDTAYIKPNDLAVKIYLLRDAEKLTPPAQNALLKLFEEPPSGVYFLLMATQASALLPTVRSRAPELRTEIFDHRTMTAYLTAGSKKAAELQKNDPTAFQRILHAAAGSYGRALQLLEARGKKSVRGFEAAETVLRALAGSDKGAFFLALLNEAAERESFAELLRLLQAAFRDMIAARRCDPPPELLFFPDAEAASALSSAFTLPTLLKLYAQVERFSGQLSEINVNLRTAAVAAASRLWELK